MIAAPMTRAKWLAVLLFGIALAGGPAKSQTPTGPGPLEAASPAVGSPAPTQSGIEFIASDRHVFHGDYFAPAREAAPAVLLVPAPGEPREGLAGLAAALAARGYHVLSIDNHALLRSLRIGMRGDARLAPNGSKDLVKTVRDLEAGAAWLKKLPGVLPARLAVIGAGLGANLGLLLAARDQEVGAAVFLLPGFGCPEMEPLPLLNRLGKRPALLIATNRDGIKESDFKRDFLALAHTHVSRVRDVVDFVPDEGSNAWASGKPGWDSAHLERSVMDWIGRNFPANPS